MSGPLDQRRVSVVLSGTVQGVFFRGSASDRARRLGLSGFVRNLADGRVEAEFQGPPAAVEAAVAFCRQRPPGAAVRTVEVRDLAPVPGAEGFEVR